MEFNDIEEFVELLRTRQTNLSEYKKETPTDWQKRQHIAQIEEVDHFIDLIYNSNLTVRPGVVNHRPKVRKARISTQTSTQTKFKPNTKKSIILKYIREHDDKVTTAQVATALNFEMNSVSAHMSALKSARLLENAEGLWWATAQKL